MNTEHFDEEMKETFNHRTRNKTKEGLLVSQLSYSDFNVPQKVFAGILAELRQRKLEIKEDPELIRYPDYLWIFNECRSRPIHDETIEEIYKKLKGSQNLTVSGLLEIIQRHRPKTTEIDLLNLLKKYGINYTEHEGILPKEFIELLSRAQRRST
jgi:hypothetical protein